MATNLDEELESAIQAELPAVSRSAEPVSAPKRPRSRNSNLILLAVLLAMTGAVATLFLVGFKDAAIYAMGADEAVAKAATLQGKRLRIEGELVPGSLVKRDTPCEYRFRIQQNGVEMPVRFAKCVIPDTFRDRPEGGVQVTVEGELLAEGGRDAHVLEATTVMAKCASKYDPATHEMQSPDGPGAAFPAAAAKAPALE